MGERPHDLAGRRIAAATVAAYAPALGMDWNEPLQARATPRGDVAAPRLSGII